MDKTKFQVTGLFLRVPDKIFLLVIFLLVILILPSRGWAQSYLTQVGDTSFSTKIPVEIGSYDASTGNLHLEIPLGAWPQRGGPTLTAALVYDSRIWYAAGAWQPTNVPNSISGWHLVTRPFSGGTIAYNSQQYDCFCEEPPCRNTPKYYIYSNFTWTDPYGTIRAFPISTEYDPHVCDVGNRASGTAYANDSSGYYMTVANYTSVSSITVPDGTRVYPSFEDRNGNYFTTDTSGNIVDTLGRTPVKLTTTNCNANQICYDVLNSQGTTSRYTVNTTSINVQTAFHQSGVTEYSGNITVVSDIQLPGNKNYILSYDHGQSGTYGELTGVTLPTNGSIGYGYTTYVDGFGNANRWLYTRTSGGGTWTYAPLYTGSNCGTGYSVCQKVTATKPSGDTVEYDFATSAGSNGSWSQGIIYHKASGSQVASVGTTWSGVQTYVQKLSVSSLFLDSASPNPEKTVQYTYTGYNTPQLTQIAEWNYYPLNGKPSTPDRVTNFSNYCGMSPGSIQVASGGGTTIAQTNITYDSYGSGLVSITGVTHHDDTNFGQSYTTRCNPTSIAKLVGSSYLTTSMTYDTTGQVRSATDPAGNATTMSYADSFYNDNNANPPSSYSPPTPTNAYLTNVTLPMIGAETLGYYYGTGQLAFSTDQNSATNYHHYFDSFNRPTETLLSDGGWNLLSYPLTTEADSFVGITTATPSTSCSSCREDTTIVDGFARVDYGYLVNDPDGETAVATSYDSSSRVASVTNPYRGPSNGQDAYTYDALDRTTKVAHTDGTAVNIFYGGGATAGGGIAAQLCSTSTYGLGYQTLTVDEAGRKREVWTDGFGRTIEVDEPDSNNSLTKNTCYAYDLNNNLTQVVSATSQTRSYQYDALSRLISVATPETNVGGTQYQTTYSYPIVGSLCSGNPGAVCQRTDPRGKTTTYTYDALNRPIRISYSDSTPTVTYCYDGNNSSCVSGYSSSNPKGRRTAMADGSGNTGWSYSPTGRVLSEQRTIAGKIKTISYAYNLDGSVASITYPSGRVVTYGVGNAERALSATDSNGTQYALTASYAPTGALSSVIYGKVTGTFNGVTESRVYNNRMELNSILASSTNGTAINLTPCYTAFSFANGCSATSAGNNGSVTGLTNSVDSNESQTFAYDNLNRIAVAATNATSGNDCWGTGFGIDAVSNLTGMTPTQCGSGGNLNVSTDGYNHLVSTGYSYDNAGNMTSDAAYTYAYDAENRITSANGVNYTYDGNGLRVEKSSGTLYWRSIWGDALAESDLQGNITNEYVFFAGRRIARISSSTVNYFYSDALGTTHTVTDATGHPCYDASFTPYGQEVLNPNVSQTCSSNYKFTGYEYDSETGLYYAFARYYNARLGRFMSADPLGGEGTDPQSLNGYSYVLNMPCNSIDPLGLGQCNFNVNINNQAGLSDTQIKAIEGQIQALFSASSDGQPNSVGINFTSGGADYNLTFDNNGVPGSDEGGYDRCYWFLGNHCETSGVVHANLASGNYSTRALGVGGAHEMGHGLGNFGDTNFNDVGSTLMSIDTNPAWKLPTNQNPLFSSDFPAGLLFTPKQIAALFKKCQHKHPNAPAGGGGGDIGSTPSTWFFQYISANPCVSEDFLTGEGRVVTRFSAGCFL